MCELKPCKVGVAAAAGAAGIAHIGQVRPASADVGAEHVGAVALVVRAAGNLTEGSQEDEEQS